MSVSKILKTEWLKLPDINLDCPCSRCNGYIEILQNSTTHQIIAQCSEARNKSCPNKTMMANRDGDCVGCNKKIKKVNIVFLNLHENDTNKNI